MYIKNCRMELDLFNISQSWIQLVITLLYKIQWALSICESTRLQEESARINTSKKQIKGCLIYAKSQTRVKTSMKYFQVENTDKLLEVKPF